MIDASAKAKGAKGREEGAPLALILKFSYPAARGAMGEETGDLSRQNSYDSYHLPSMRSLNATIIRSAALIMHRL